MPENNKVYDCKSCIHSYRYFPGYLIFDFSESAYKCKLTLKVEKSFSPVTGRQIVEKKVSFCVSERNYGECGTYGKHWSPRKKKDLFKLLRK